jgi:aminopeptidase C
MNSWGTDFGDQGFFKVSNTEVLNLYYFDVFWYENNLRPSEKEYFRNYGQENTKRYLQTLQGLSRT